MLCLCLRPFNVNNVRMMFGARTVTMRVVLEVLGVKEWDVIEVTVNEPPIPFRIKHVREQTILFPPWQRHKPVISSRWLNATLSFRTHYCIHAINSSSLGNNPRKNYRFNCLKGSICPDSTPFTSTPSRMTTRSFWSCWDPTSLTCRVLSFIVRGICMCNP